MPAAPPTVTGYLSELARHGAKVGTMSRRVSGIKFARQLRKLPDPSRNAREDDEWNSGHAPDAVHRPLGLLSPTSVPDDRPIIAVCRSGQRFGRATQALTAAGHDVRNLDGGCTPGQPPAGLPVVRTDGGIGLSLDEVAEAPERLPGGRTPNKSDWASCPGLEVTARRADLRSRSAAGRLGACTGCGCLSLRRCAIADPSDVAAARGSGVYLRRPLTVADGR